MTAFQDCDGKILDFKFYTLHSRVFTKMKIVLNLLKISKSHFLNLLQYLYAYVNLKENVNVFGIQRSIIVFFWF